MENVFYNLFTVNGGARAVPLKNYVRTTQGKYIAAYIVGELIRRGEWRLFCQIYMLLDVINIEKRLG